MAIHKPILVTGSHRSGTTWTGNMIAASGEVAYIQEPFNIGMNLGVMPIEMRYWFQFICNENDFEFKEAFDDVVRFRYPLQNNLKKCDSVRDIIKVMYYHGSSMLHGVRNKRPLLKDPIAFYSSEWLYEKYDCDVIVLIRHPATFYSSLKLKNWAFDFNNFLDQPLLMKHVLGSFKSEIEGMVGGQKDLIDQAILLWNCIHQTILDYRDRHKDWMFIRHEDLSLDPLSQFRKIFDFLNLDYSKKVQSVIQEASGSHNPGEQSTKHEFIRNSKKNIYNWKMRLTEEEILTIRSGTSEIAGKFYNANDW